MILSPADQQKLRETFEQITTPVRLLFFTQTIGCDTCVQTRQILDELPALSDKISIEEVNLVLDKDKAKQYGIDRVPAVAIVGQNGADRPTGELGAGAAGEVPGAFKDTRIRFFGAPAGYEFVSLIQAVLLVGGRGSILTEENRRRIAAVDAPIVMQVFTTPT